MAHKGKRDLPLLPSSVLGKYSRNGNIESTLNFSRFVIKMLIKFYFLQFYWYYTPIKLQLWIIWSQFHYMTSATPKTYEPTPPWHICVISSFCPTSPLASPALLGGLHSTFGAWLPSFRPQPYVIFEFRRNRRFTPCRISTLCQIIFSVRFNEVLRFWGV